MGNNQHLVPHKDGWAVRGSGNSRITSILPTKQQTKGVTREIARNQKAELVVHGKDGRIQSKDSFGHDPCPPKDKR